MAYRSPNVYKIIVMAIYGEYKWMQRLGNGMIEVRTKNMSELLHCSAASLRDFLRWIEQYKYISQLELGYGYARFKVNKPKLLLKEYGYDQVKESDDKETL